MPSSAGDGLLGAIVRLNLSVSNVLEQIASSAGLTMADYLVLGVIRNASSGRSAPTALSAILGRTTGGMTLTLDRLVNDGLVIRSADPFDGRRVVVELTAKGQEVALHVNTQLHAWESKLDLPGDESTVLELIESLNSAVSNRSEFSTT
ncbi:MAG: MarR family transcriptional regulator [Microthrixaceae bacterium]